MKKLILLICVLFFVGCAPVTYHKGQLRDDSGDRMTVGTVQREIKIGMSSSKVAEILGSPNVVSTDEERREVWIYDKIATEIIYSNSNSGLKFLTSGSAGGATKSQRTLTVIIKFDKDSKVRDFAYHTSRF
jgi:outer membrane protein assembly factor BamE (lipoprotein component of BamABCDE complex)